MFFPTFILVIRYLTFILLQNGLNFVVTATNKLASFVNHTILSTVLDFLFLHLNSDVNTLSAAQGLLKRSGSATSKTHH